MNHAEPVPADRPIEPPYPLTRAVQDVWDDQAPDRIAKGVLTAWDVWAFAFWCESVVLARQGFVRARNDRPTPGAPSPMSMAKDAVTLASSLGGRFGWTPSDRAKLTVGEDSRRDDKADLLSS